MAFELKPGRPVDKRIRKIVCERIDMALEELQDGGQLPSDEAVHQTRRRLKQIRGTLRLAREELGKRTFRRENEVFRDAGRPLSAVRDARTTMDTLDKLVEHFGRSAKTSSMSHLRELLMKRHRATRREVLGQNGTVPALVRTLTKAKNRVKDWPLRRHGFGAISGGLERVYAAARRAMNEAQANCSDETLHEWRKRTQDLRYDLELLKPTWPETIGPVADEVHKLSDLLGDDHDLLVLRGVAESEMSKNAVKGHEIISAIIPQRRKELQHEAFDLGAKLYQEDENAFVERLKGYWKASSRGIRGPLR